MNPETSRRIATLRFPLLIPYLFWNTLTLLIVAAYIFSLDASLVLHHDTIVPSVRVGRLSGVLFAAILLAEIVLPAGLGDVFHRSLTAYGGVCVLSLSQAVLPARVVVARWARDRDGFAMLAKSVEQRWHRRHIEAQIGRRERNSRKAPCIE